MTELELLRCAVLALGLTLLAVVLGARALRKALLPLRGPGLVLRLKAEGDGAGLEQQCRAWRLLHSRGLLSCPLEIEDAGLTEEGRAVAAKLCRMAGGQ